jgi:hypothetical protein
MLEEPNPVAVDACIAKKSRKPREPDRQVVEWLWEANAGEGHDAAWLWAPLMDNCDWFKNRTAPRPGRRVLPAALGLGRLSVVANLRRRARRRSARPAGPRASRRRAQLGRGSGVGLDGLHRLEAELLQPSRPESLDDQVGAQRELPHGDRE